MRILILDNDKVWIKYLQGLLVNNGHNINIASDYEYALKKVNDKCKFELIFSDFEIFKRNKKFVYNLISQGIYSRVIITTDSPNYKDAMFSKRYGAIDYIEKKYNENEILNIITNNKNKHLISEEYLRRILREEECSKENLKYC